MLVELIKGVKQAFRENRGGKMLIDRQKMLVLPFMKTPRSSGLRSGLPYWKLHNDVQERKSLKQ
jgi:hypothetical protein